MRLRHQLPVYSPVTMRTVRAGVAGMLGFDGSARATLADSLQRTYDAQDVVLCGSGTQALQIAIESARRELGPDSVVALPAFTCFDVATAAVGAGAPVSLYDLDPLSLSPDLASLGRALDAGARILVIAPLYGIPVDWERIAQLASARGALLIEDAAQGHGATYRGAPLGAFGDISTLSFGRGKGWTGGSGGAVLFRRGRVFQSELHAPPRERVLESAVVLAAQWGFGRPAMYGLPRSLPGLELGETIYHEPRRPEAMSDSAAAAILASRDLAIREAEARRANARWIREELASQTDVREIITAAREATAGYLRFPVLAARGLRGFTGDVKALGVEPSYPQTLATLKQLGPLIVGAREFPGADRLVSELVTLPVHSLLSSGDRSRLGERIQEYNPG